MNKTVKSVLDARDYINNLTFEVVKNIIISADRIEYENGIIGDFINYCKGIDFWSFDDKFFYNLRNTWVMSLTSVVLEDFNLAINS